MKKIERRYKKRLAIDIKVKVYRIDKNTRHVVSAYLFETKDMTQNGFFLKTSEVFPVGTKVELKFILLPNIPEVTAEGRVARIAKPMQRGCYPGMGIEIVKIKKSDSKMIKDFLSQKFKNYRQAVELKKMYLQLKEMGGRLYDLEQSHPHAEHFRQVIDQAVKQIDYIAHVLDKEVWEVKSL